MSHWDRFILTDYPYKYNSLDKKANERTHGWGRVVSR